MRKDKTKIIVVLILILMCLMFSRSALNDSNDTFYLIKLGDYILEKGIDYKDHFSWIPNLSYTYPHWLYSVFCSLAFGLFKYKGIFLFNFGSYVLLILSIYFVNLKINKSNFMAFLISIISILVFRPLIVMRSYVFSTIIFLMEVFFIHELITTGKKRYILFLFILSVLLANIHGTSWIMFFILFLPFFAEKIVFMIKKKRWSIESKIDIEKSSNMNLVLLAFVFSFLGGLISPSKICYTYVFKIMQGNSQLHIAEHSPLVLYKYPIVIISLFFLYFSEKKMKLHEFLIIFGLTIMVFSSIRHILFFYTIVFLYLSIILMRNVHHKNEYTFSFLENLFLRKRVLIPILLVCMLGSIYNVKTKIDEPLDESIYPVEATKYIRNNLDYNKIRLYNDYDVGSYLLFNNIKVFVDSRCDLYLPEFNTNINALNDYFEIKKTYDYEKIFEKYQIDYVLTNKSEILYKIIVKDSLYHMIYEDQNFAIFQKIQKEKKN